MLGSSLPVQLVWEFARKPEHLSEETFEQHTGARSGEVPSLIRSFRISAPSTTHTPRRVHWTKRERTILEELVEGKTSLEIASTLQLQVSTIENYIRTMRSKARASNRVALVLVYVTQHGLRTEPG